MGRIRVELADAAGFCFGVRNALGIAEREAAKEGSVLTYGELIHNHSALDQLAESNITAIDDVANAKGTVVIRAHGIRSSEKEALEENADCVVDGTCPMVLTIKRAIDEALANGHLVLLLGNPNHPEVIGLKDDRDKVVVLRGPDDFEHVIVKSTISSAKRVTLVAQSTQLIERFDQTAEALLSAREDAEIRNTICSPTRKRQTAAIELAKRLPLIIVVGDSHSSNTQHLLEMAKQFTKAKRVSSPDDLVPDWFDGVDHVGLTAGASTPDETIRAVLHAIEALP